MWDKESPVWPRQQDHRQRREGKDWGKEVGGTGRGRGAGAGEQASQSWPCPGALPLCMNNSKAVACVEAAYATELAFQTSLCSFIYRNMLNYVYAFFLWCHFPFYNTKCIFIDHICLSTYKYTDTRAHVYKYMCTTLLSSP